MHSDEFFGTGRAVEADSPIFGDTWPLNRSAPTLAKVGAGCTSDQHTAAVLIEIGISEDRIAELKQQKIIGSLTAIRSNGRFHHAWRLRTECWISSSTNPGR